MEQLREHFKDFTSSYRGLKNFLLTFISKYD